MADSKFLKTNVIEIVGTLTKADVEVKTSKKDGTEFISGTITVEAQLDGETNNFDLSIYAKKVTKDGNISKLFTNYEDLPKLLNQKVRVNGDLREERYFNKTTSQVTSLQRLEARFINAEASVTPERATFEFGGFVTKEVVALKNKEGATYAYEIEVGQADYSDKILNNYKFHIRPDAMDIVNAISKMYLTKSTVKFGGELRWVTKTQEVTTQSGFGEPRTRVYTNTNRNYFITYGDEPITGESKYDDATIASVVKAYSARDVELNSAATATASVGTAPVTSRQTSLI